MLWLSAVGGCIPGCGCPASGAALAFLHHDLSRARNQVTCRLHAALRDLVPGGFSKEIHADQADQVLAATEPRGAVQQARAELAAELVADMRRVDALLRETKKKLAAAVRASGTSLTVVFGVGPVIAATVIGDVRDVSRFGSRDGFAAYNGTAPIEVSSGNRIIHRLSLRGNRRLNHAIHMAAITQIRYKHSDGRTYYDKKLAEGKAPKEALRALKRQISDAIYKCLKADAVRIAAASALGPGGSNPGTAPRGPLSEPRVAVREGVFLSAWGCALFAGVGRVRSRVAATRGRTCGRCQR